MLLPDNVHPEQTIYYNAAFVLDRLVKCRRIELFDLYNEVKEEKPMSFATFQLCLDWLFIIKVIESNDGSIVELCI